MKKVGIVSLYNGQNFGNKLQNYAAEQICFEYGFHPYTFKYEIVQDSSAITSPSLIKKLRPSYIAAFVKSFLSGRCQIKNTDTSAVNQFVYWYKNRANLALIFKRRTNKYNSFDYRHLNFSQRSIKYNEINSDWAKEYSMFFAGSDQVWNPYYLFVSSNNFLQFVDEEKRAGLAPSFGVSTIPPERKDDFSKWLDGFKFLSVREDAGAKIIKDLTGRDAVVIADPTMIASREIWDKLAAKPDFDLPKKYLLTYFLGDRTKKYSKYVTKLAEKYDLEIVNLLDILSPQYLTCDPAEFVYCVQNAKLVCTDSFHATVFSILYKKPFITFDRVEGDRKMGSRIDTLLGAFSMQNRKFENIIENENPEEIDFSTSDIKLQELRNAANDYLKKVFEAAKNTDTEINTEFNVYNTDDCTGCMACVAGCPKNALSIETRNGFNYPKLDEGLCINCGKCDRICPVYNAKKIDAPQKAYAMRIKNKEDILNGSSSGGVVTAISNQFIDDGLVVGADFCEDFSVKHVAVDSKDDLVKIRKAKYVQSSILDTFDDVKAQLKLGKKVLFTGTPCQVAAIKSYCGDSENLFTAGIVCHGVPSPVLWQEHLRKLEVEHNSKLVSVDFRDKSNGWKAYRLRYEFENGKELLINPSSDAYMSAFYHNKSLRLSCANCHFKAGNSGADIIIGDFWGLDSLAPELDNDKGMSVVTIHTEKGQQLINDDVEIVKEFDCVTAMGQNPSYYYSSIIQTK